jgi:hypothetical protein
VNFALVGLPQMRIVNTIANKFAGMFVIDERLRGIPIPNEIPRQLLDRI